MSDEPVICGERVLCRPHWWTRQWVHGYVQGVGNGRAVIKYGVDSDFGSFTEARSVPLRRVVRLAHFDGYPATTD